MFQAPPYFVSWCFRLCLILCPGVSGCAVVFRVVPYFALWSFRLCLILCPGVSGCAVSGFALFCVLVCQAVLFQALPYFVSWCVRLCCSGLGCALFCAVCFRLCLRQVLVSLGSAGGDQCTAWEPDYACKCESSFLHTSLPASCLRAWLSACVCVRACACVRACVRACVCVFMPVSIFKAHISGKECDFKKLKEEKKEKKKKEKKTTPPPQKKKKKFF